MLRKAVVFASVLVTALAGVSIPSSGAEEVSRPCGEAADQPVVTEAAFNDPVAGDPTAVVRQICNLVHQAPSGSQLRIAHFVISGEAGMDFVTELIDAHRRGVDVQIVLDGWQVDNPAVDSLKAALGTDQSQRSWLHVCTRLSPEGSTSACIGDKGQHNKFYLFSETGGRSDVVVQSSANFTDTNSTTYWNNAVTFVGNSRLYDAYDSYFEDLAAEVETDNYYRVTTTAMPTGMVRSYFFPRAGTDASTDPIVEILDKVSCRGGTELRIGMSEWDVSRMAIADRVVELSEQDCDIKIVHGAIDPEIKERLAAAPGIQAGRLDTSRELPGRIHSKYMIVDGTYDGEKDARWVFTGSPNFTHTSLRRNDEAMIQTNVTGLYEQYLANFTTMFDAAQAAD